MLAELHVPEVVDHVPGLVAAGGPLLLHGFA